MTTTKGDILIHTNGTVYTVRSAPRGFYGTTGQVNLYNHATSTVEQFSPKVLDQFFTQVDTDFASDVLEMGKLGYCDYESLRSVRREYVEYLAGCDGNPARWDTAYTDEEIRTIIDTADNLVALYQLAMAQERTVSGIKYVLKKASSLDATRWKQWKEKGVPGDSSYWQIHSVLKSMGGTYNPLLDVKPELVVTR